MTNTEKTILGIVIALLLLGLGSSLIKQNKIDTYIAPPDKTHISDGKDEKYRNMMVNCLDEFGNTLPSSYCDK